MYEIDFDASNLQVEEITEVIIQDCAQETRDALNSEFDAHQAFLNSEEEQELERCFVHADKRHRKQVEMGKYTRRMMRR